jgi:hypothetical protein
LVGFVPGLGQAKIVAKYKSYRVRSDTLVLIFDLSIDVNLSQFEYQQLQFIVIPKLVYNVSLYKCLEDATKMRCDPFLSDVYKGELYWLTVPRCWCPEYSPNISRAHCSYEGVELRIPISKRILDALMEIATNRKEQARPALHVELKTCDRVPQPMPHAIAFYSQSQYSQTVTPLLLEEIRVIGSKKAENSSPYIVLEPDDVAKILKEAKYFEEIRIALEINALESAGPLEIPVKDLKNAFEELERLNPDGAVINCRKALEVIKRGLKTINPEDANKSKEHEEHIRDYILNKYDEDAKKVYAEILEKVYDTVKNLYDIMSKFIHEQPHTGEPSAAFNPTMADAIYLCRQTAAVIDYLARLAKPFEKAYSK